eukprot:gene13037-biopygen7352
MDDVPDRRRTESWQCVPALAQAIHSPWEGVHHPPQCQCASRRYPGAFLWGKTDWRGEDISIGVANRSSQWTVIGIGVYSGTLTAQVEMGTGYQGEDVSLAREQLPSDPPAPKGPRGLITR